MKGDEAFVENSENAKRRTAREIACKEKKKVHRDIVLSIIIIIIIIWGGYRTTTLAGSAE